MRRREPEPPPVPEGVPVELLLGPCVELFVPSASPMTAETRALRFGRAHRRWLQERAGYLRRPGALVVDLDHVPDVAWSFAEQTPHERAKRLLAAGLPSDWTPSP